MGAEKWCLVCVFMLKLAVKHCYKILVAKLVAIKIFGFGGFFVFQPSSIFPFSFEKAPLIQEWKSWESEETVADLVALLW